MMSKRRAFGSTLLTSVALTAAAACQPAVRYALLAERQPTVCYRLEFAPWTSASRAPFAKAAVGLVSPLPDTIALTGTLSTQHGRAYYVAVRMSADLMHPAGTWTQARHDTLLVDFPSDVGDGLMIRLFGSGEQLEGQAWVYLDRDRTVGKVLYDPVGPPVPWSTVTALRVSCPSTLSPSAPGAYKRLKPAGRLRPPALAPHLKRDPLGGNHSPNLV